MRYWRGPTFQESGWRGGAGGGGGGSPECEVLAWTNIPAVRVAGRGGGAGVRSVRYCRGSTFQEVGWRGVRGFRTVRYRRGPTFQEARGKGGVSLECEVLTWTNISGGRGGGGQCGGGWQSGVAVRYWCGPTFQKAGWGVGGGGLECEVLTWTNIPGGGAVEGVRGLDCEVLTWTNIPGGRGGRRGWSGVLRYWCGPTFQEAGGVWVGAVWSAEVLT